MWYGDPRDARRAARYTRRNARRSYRYRYGRRGSGIFGLLFFVFLMLAIFTHIWAWFVPGIIILAVLFWLLRAGMFGAWFSGSQQPYQNQPPPEQQPYYQPPPEAQLPDQPYERGYQPARGAYQEGEQRYQYPHQAPDPEYQQYEEPRAQYPEQMPPMQQ